MPDRSALSEEDDTDEQADERSIRPGEEGGPLNGRAHHKCGRLREFWPTNHNQDKGSRLTERQGLRVRPNFSTFICSPDCDISCVPTNFNERLGG